MAVLVSCNSDSQHNFRAGHPPWRRFSSVTYAQYSPSSCLASRVPRSGTYATELLLQDTRRREPFDGGVLECGVARESYDGAIIAARVFEATRLWESSVTMTADEALAFVATHGVVLESASGPVPSLVATILGEPIRGSWWDIRRVIRSSGSLEPCVSPRPSWCVGWSAGRSALCIAGYGQRWCGSPTGFRRTAWASSGRCIRLLATTESRRRRFQTGCRRWCWRTRRHYLKRRRSACWDPGCHMANLTPLRSASR